MNRAEHVAESERLLDRSCEHDVVDAMLYATQAQVHATLAHSAHPMVLIVENGTDPEVIRAALASWTNGVES